MSLDIKQAGHVGRYYDKTVGRFYEKKNVYNDMTDDDNKDPEIDEANIVWEIERDWGAMYYRQSTTILIKNIRNLRIIDLCNLRKQYGFEGELLVRWNSGQRDWSPVSQVYVDSNNAYTLMVNNYLRKINQTMSTVDFGLYNKQQEESEEKRLHEKRVKQQQKELREMDVARKIQPTNKQLPLKRKLESEYEKPKGKRNSKRIMKNISPNPKHGNAPHRKKIATRNTKLNKHGKVPNPNKITERVTRKSKIVGNENTDTPANPESDQPTHHQDRSMYVNQRPVRA